MTKHTKLLMKTILAYTAVSANSPHCYQYNFSNSTMEIFLKHDRKTKQLKDNEDQLTNIAQTPKLLAAWNYYHRKDTRLS